MRTQADLPGRPSQTLPMRQLTRLRAEMGIAAARHTASLFPDRPMLGIEFGTIVRYCLPDWVRGDDLMRPLAPTREITVRQIARSLRAAPETTRRHVNMLHERGVVKISPSGVSLATKAENERRVVDYLLAVHDIWLRMMEDMTRTCDLVLSVGPVRAFHIADVIERALDTLLLPLDASRPAMNQTTFLLWGALTVAAVRNVTYDPVLARRYAVSIPPDDLRTGVSLHLLADALSFSYATVWRHVKALEANDLVSRLADGKWTVLTRNLLQEQVRDIAGIPSALMLRRIYELTRLGFDPAHAGSRYRVARPLVAELGLS